MVRQPLQKSEKFLGMFRMRYSKKSHCLSVSEFLIFMNAISIRIIP